eukprot:5095569-Prymnesium_polylepis.1
MSRPGIRPRVVSQLHHSADKSADSHSDESPDHATGCRATPKSHVPTTASFSNPDRFAYGSNSECK